MNTPTKRMERYRRRLAGILSCRRIWIGLLAAFVAVFAFCYIRFAMNAGVDHDEVEHAHAAFKLLNGAIPYRDFYQNHLPAYWLVDMPLVRAFPFSTHAILAARGVGLLALAGCWLFGLRLLGSIRGGRTWLGLSIYTWAIITLAYQMEFHEARPDPIMALLGTAGLCLIPAQGGISKGRALLLGILFGLSASVSTKVMPMTLVVPALIILHCIRARRFQPAAALFPYGFGALLALMPTALWIFHKGLFDAFCFDVFSLNISFSNSWRLSFGFLLIPIYLASALGALSQLGSYGRRSNRDANGPLVIILALAAGIVLALIARHWCLYNLQLLTIPIAVGFAGLVVSLWLRVRGLSSQLLLCGALIGYPALHVASPLVMLRQEPGTIPLREMQRIMDLARPGNRTCIAFSPAHPVFCRDISGLSNGWDMIFARRVRNPRQAERFRKLWHDGIQRTLNEQPDIILRRSPQNCWEQAVEAGLVTSDELHALDALRSAYDVKNTGSCEVWIRHSR
jgi:hypothetical protein